MMFNPFLPTQAMTSWMGLAASMSEASFGLCRALVTPPGSMLRTTAPASRAPVARSTPRTQAPVSSRQSLASTFYDPFGWLEISRRMMQAASPSRAAKADAFFPMAAVFPFAVGHPADSASMAGTMSRFATTAFPRVFLGYAPATPLAFGTPYDGWGLLTFGFAVPPGLARMAGNPSPLWLAV